jgi:hypothetical protein
VVAARRVVASPFFRWPTVGARRGHSDRPACAQGETANMARIDRPGSGHREPVSEPLKGYPWRRYLVWPLRRWWNRITSQPDKPV